MIALDVLALIFAKYREQESVDDTPLETLLLVCRAWRDLCLDLHQLWSNFNIVFGSGRQARKWAHILPKRLVKSGQSTPLHITILNNRKRSHRHRDPQTGRVEHDRCPELESEYALQSGDELAPACTCPEEIPGIISDILEILAGRKGERCHRWATLHLYLNARGYHNRFFATLSYPTPNLRSLTLQGMDSARLGTDGPILFPNLPLLVDMSLKYSRLPHLRISSGGVPHTGLYIRRLELQEYTSYPAHVLLQTLHSLTSLVIRGNCWCRSDGPLISVPNLTSFTRELTPASVHQTDIGFLIPFENLRTLGIFFHGRLRNALPELASPYTKLLIEVLSRATHVEMIAGDEFSVMTLLLILSTSPRPEGFHPTVSSLKVCVMDRRDASSIEWALGGGQEVYVIDLGDSMEADMDRVRQRRGWVVA